MASTVEKALLAFLRDPRATCFALCGDVGSGKLRTTSTVARGQGWPVEILDRALGHIDFSKFGNHTLGNDSPLTTTVYIICNAKESNWDFIPCVKGKFVFIANDAADLAPLKRYKIGIETKKCPRSSK